MSLQVRLSDLITAIGTDYKQLRVWLTGSSTGDLTGLTTTAKTSIVAAINEVKAGNAGSPPAATTTVAGTLMLATQAEVDAGVVTTDAVTPATLQSRLAGYAQPLAANLTTLAGVASSSIGRTILAAADAAAVKTSLSLTKTDVGLSAVPNTDATARANHTGTQAATTITGLAAVATSGSASDITTGTLPSSVIPTLAINETFTAATQAAMLALTAQRGDMAIRTDLGGKFYILITDSPTTLADWKPLVSSSDVTSVAGRTGVVVLTSTDVGLGNVDNTSDVNKPVSTAQSTADNLRLLKSANLSDVASASTSLTNLGGVSTTTAGNIDVDLVALYTAAKA
jgi:hypothetical protein